MQLATDESVQEALKPRTGRWRWPLALGAVVLAVGAVAWFWGRGRAPIEGFDTEVVRRGDLAVTVTAVGKLGPIDEVAVSSELSGIVRSVYVDTNDAVFEGQVMAELDTNILESQAQQAWAQVQAAQASARQALVNVQASQRDLDRVASLASKGAASQEALDQARTAHEVAVASLAVTEAQLAQARASNQAARTNLDKARILSPIDGVVLERNVEPGQAVVSSLQAATLFRVAGDLARMAVDVEIDEADVGRIQPGQEADFTVAAYSDRVFDARVEKVDLAPTDSSEVVTYGAELHLDNQELLLRPGMTATASISTESHDGVLLVPNAALRFTPEDADLAPPEPREGRRVARVWTVSEGELRAVEVVPVATDGRLTAIEDGPLFDGDPLVVGVQAKRR